MSRSRLLPLAAAIPFLLLHQTQDLRLLTRVERDGSGLRLLWARADASRAAEVRTKFREAAQGYEDERSVIEGSQFIISRSWRPHDLALVPDSKLEIVDVVQKPLSLYSTYRWEEKLTVYAGPATDSEKAGAKEATLTYILEMPGRVDPASVSPAGTVSGNKVVWTVRGDKEEHVLRATSRLLRWDVLILVFYVAGVVSAKGAYWLVRRARARPRRI